MKKSKKRRIFFVIIIGLFMSLVPVVTSSEAGEINDAKKAELALREKKAKMQQKKEILKQKKNDLLEYIEVLDGALEEIEENIVLLKEEIREKKAYVKELQMEVDELQKEVDMQYETMKKRIKYMYENGNREYVELILSSASFGEMLNRVEYVSKITQYDNELMDRYVELYERKEGKKLYFEDQLRQLKLLKKEKKYDRKTVKELKKEKNAEIEAYNKKIEKTKEEIKQYNEKIAEQEAFVEQLLIEERQRVELEQKKWLEEHGDIEGDFTDFDPDRFLENPDSDTLFIWPLAVPGIISGDFGWREIPIEGASPNHNGLDIAVPKGTPILASASGKVVVSRYSSSAGNFIMIYHGGSTYTVYMHASRRIAEVGDEVFKGQVIAYVGSTGLSTGPHLHFGISVDGNYINPLLFVKQRERGSSDGTE